MAHEKMFPPLTDVFLKVPLYEALDLTLPSEVTRAKVSADHLRAQLEAQKAALGAPPPVAPSLTSDEEERQRKSLTSMTNSESVKRFVGPLDAYCLGCRAPSIFGHARAASGGGSVVDFDVFDQAYFSKNFVCTRHPDHRLHFAFRHDTKAMTLTKIGQFPSIADLALPDAQRYRTILGPDRYKEFARAIGLFAHGIGVGSFVYLRRIFEGRIDDAHEYAKADKDWDETTYPLRMEDRILALRAHLPQFLVANRALYSIMSLGLHELTEEDCLAHFPVVRTGIELILDEKIVEQEREAKIKASQSAISILAGTLKKPQPKP